MTDTTLAPSSPPPSEAHPSKPWYDGIDAETIGWAQNRGIKVDDPKEAFAISLKQVRDFEKHFGVPPDQLLKMPKADAKPEDHKAFWGRLGAGEPKDYDLSSVKTGDGKDLPPAFVDAMKAAMASAFVPKERAKDIVDAVVKYAATEISSKETTAIAKLAEERATLDKNWGQNKNLNSANALNAERRLGLPPGKSDEIAEALSKAGVLGFDQAKDLFRRIGQGSAEDTFVERGASSGPGQGIGVTTREGAVARKAELMADKEWGERYISGGAAEAREMNALNMMIDGEAA